MLKQTQPIQALLQIKIDAVELHNSCSNVPGGITAELLQSMKDKKYLMSVWNLGNITWSDPCSGIEYKVSVLFIATPIHDIQRMLLTQ